MRKIFACFVFCFVAIAAKAQPAAPKYEAYGKVDKEDLELKECDFEKDANAEVLFDKGVIERGEIDRHIRVKIFNTAGVKEANIRLIYLSYRGLTGITGFKAETINYDDGKVTVTPIDKKAIYTEQINAFLSALVFAFPDVKPGSIIEYKYTSSPNKVWYFQSNIPTRYSEIQATFTATNHRYIPHVHQPFTNDTGRPFDNYQDKVLTNVNSLPNEPYMGGRKDNLQRMEYWGQTIATNTWPEIGNALMRYDEFGGQLNRGTADESSIIKQAKSLRSADEKIAYIFNRVKNTMKWNNINSFAAIDGTTRAWDKKTGNSAEINLILYHLLKEAKITAYPMIISTKENGKINPFNPDIYSINSTVVCVPVDTTDADNPKYYVLDASNKFNLFNEIPKDMLNTFGVCIPESIDAAKAVFLQNKEPASQAVYINAEISSGGKMTGTAELTNYSYNKIDNLDKYITNDEVKFKTYLSNNDNNLKILSLKTDNSDVDSLPLVQTIKFASDLNSSDDNYIYFSPNLFITPHKNPFVNQTRYSDVEFGYLDNTSITGNFKIPAGYKLDAAPKNMVMIMPDTSIIFRRSVNEDQGSISIRYVITRKKTLYSPTDYPDLYAFYKKMYEMLNEQIVLKKS